jgi:hypothetical protein
MKNENTYGLLIGIALVTAGNLGVWLIHPDFKYFLAVTVASLYLGSVIYLKIKYRSLARDLVVQSEAHREVVLSELDESERLKVMKLIEKIRPEPVGAGQPDNPPVKL